MGKMVDGEPRKLSGTADEAQMRTGRFVLFFFISLSFGFLISSCESTIPGLSSAERKMADSIYRDEMKIFRPEMDSFCAVFKDSLLPIYIDSMEKSRLAEIEKQLERIKNMK